MDWLPRLGVALLVLSVVYVPLGIWTTLHFLSETRPTMKPIADLATVMLVTAYVVFLIWGAVTIPASTGCHWDGGINCP